MVLRSIVLLFYIGYLLLEKDGMSANVSVGVQKLESIFLRSDVNQVISPFSVLSALIPLKLGSDGITRTELETALQEFQHQQNLTDTKSLDDVFSTTVVFTSASLTLLPDFRDSLTAAHVKLIEDFDFRNYEAVNEVVKNATNGLIQDLVGPTTFRKNTDLVIINGVHFDAPWKYPFQATHRDIPFTLLDGTKQEIPMMYQKSSNYFAKVVDLDSTVLELAYKSLTKVLRIYLPTKYDGLPSLLKKLGTYNTSSILLKLSEIEVTLPTFKIETQIKVTNGLDNLGLKSLTRSTANLSRISKKPLRVDEIISKSVIDVGERGTKAGSATGIFVVALSGFITDQFMANRPFYFEIRDTKSQLVYFSGVFTTPDPPSLSNPNFVSRLNQRPPEPTVAESRPSVAEPGQESTSSISDEDSEDTQWWLHKGQPEYLVSLPANRDSTPRFQQPEPIYPSGIRFPYPLKDLNTQLVIDSHLKNASINIVI